jgi:ribosomal RNA adenine dimethylase
MEEHLLGIGLNHDQIIFQDILQVDLETILSNINKNQNSTVVVGNLPYYITSPIFRLLFTNHEKGFL